MNESANEPGKGTASPTAQALFEGEGLPFPPVPAQLSASLQQQGPEHLTCSDFLGLGREAQERAIEDGLVDHIVRFPARTRRGLRIRRSPSAPGSGGATTSSSTCFSTT